MKKSVLLGSRKNMLVKRSIATAFSVLAVGSISTNTVSASPQNNNQTIHINYQTKATTAVQGLIGSYWNSTGNQFENTPGGSYAGNYW
ncbi:hypothetical protein NZD89_15225 [Alicyclobacillus fastidiosus]|uniref:Lactococcin 972 family bacteriocin n=1 Tax=Alicyclobacillus fastidiosus TaxID=392011 RepID=A0ABY6ZA68_9BACL|nr:hypothetical protein [Alicyclobacillus fastidiosus]WAH39762.1 hypothetical protein NZD89_15225 [Alicyclobacillus fastidiosus]GMA61001.1 hypothetical protein GCM10025859_14410 [Alicyclobacillus fastidiosus]